MDPVLATPSARYLGHQFTTIHRKSSDAASLSGVVSWIGHKALQCGHSKCSPGTCSRRSSRPFGSPSKRHWLTRHCGESPSAALKSSSGVILLMRSIIAPKANPRLVFLSQIPFAADSLWRGTSQELSNAKASYLPERGAKPAQGRNEINGRGPLRGKDAVYVGFDLEQA